MLGWLNNFKKFSILCLFIVGGNDKKIIEINKNTITRLINAEVTKLEVVKKKVRLKKLERLAGKWLNEALGDIRVLTNSNMIDNIQFESSVGLRQVRMPSGYNSITKT